MTAAETALLQTLEQSPEDWSIRLVVAEKMIEREAKDEAIRLLNEAPVSPPSEQKLSQVLELIGDESIPVLNQFVTRFPTSIWAHGKLAECHETAGNQDEANQHKAVAEALQAAEKSPSEKKAVTPPAAKKASTKPLKLPVPQPTGKLPARAPANAPVPKAIAAPAPVAKSSPAPELQAVSRPPAGFAAPPTDSAGIHKGRTSTKATAIGIAVLIHVALGILAFLFIIFKPGPEKPEVVAEIISLNREPKQEMQQKTVMKQVQRTSSSASAAAPIANLMRANAVAQITAPEVTKTSTGPLGLGEGNFGSGGFGNGQGLGSGGSFFGGSASGNRFLFILDYSASMSNPQMDMVVREMGRSLDALSPNVQFQVILFAGGGYYAAPGWSVTQPNNRISVVKGPDTDYTFTSKSVTDWSYGGDLPTADWISATKPNVEATMAILRRKEKFVGTDWRAPFFMGLALQPPPDVVFFMTDGTGGADTNAILAFNRRNGNAQLNTFAMQTTAGANQMMELATESGGEFKIILRGGDTITGEEYFKDPAKYRAQIGR